jgi:hypothetical protein
MCRNIRPLNNFEPPATHSEVHDAALQYVRKVAGTTKPSKANEEAFNRAVHDIAHATEHLLADLVSSAPPKNRVDEAAKARARSAKPELHRRCPRELAPAGWQVPPYQLTCSGRPSS